MQTCIYIHNTTLSVKEKVNFSCQKCQVVFDTYNTSYMFVFVSVDLSLKEILAFFRKYRAVLWFRIRIRMDPELFVGSG
jgi:hypothetical protein